METAVRPPLLWEVQFREGLPAQPPALPPEQPLVRLSLPLSELRQALLSAQLLLELSALSQEPSKPLRKTISRLVKKTVAAKAATASKEAITMNFASVLAAGALLISTLSLLEVYKLRKALRKLRQGQV